MRGWHVCKHAHVHGLVSPVTTQEVLKCTPNSPFRKMHAYDSFVEPTTKPSVDEQRSVSDSKWHPLKHDLMDDGEEAYYSRAYSYSHSQGTGEREANVFFAGLGEDLTGLTDSNMIHSAYKAMTDRQDSFLQAKRASISAWELLLYFVCGTGVSAPFIAILSSLSYFSLSYGDPKVFLYLNACVYVPPFSSPLCKHPTTVPTTSDTEIRSRIIAAYTLRTLSAQASWWPRHQSQG